MVAWAEAWSGHATAWQAPLERVRQELNVLATQLRDFAQDDEERHDRRARDLYRRRVGVSYLLPPGGSDMNHFYDLVIARMRETWKVEKGLPPAATEPDLLRSIVGRDGWVNAFDTTFEHSADQAVAELLAQVTRHVKAFLQRDFPGQLPLLPKLRDLLATAAGVGKADGAMQDYLEEFRAKLAGLVPANFEPQGTGPMKVLVSYPAPAKNQTISDYLRRSVLLPSKPGTTYDPRHTFNDSISVVLFRSAMGITEVREVREVLRLWASAIRSEQPTDKLAWRQRTGYNFGYLATREEHRVVILHRMLCALWNGKVEAVGRIDSPEEIRVTLADDITMSLPLRPIGRSSSWGSLLRTYELWAFDDSPVHRLFSAQLMQELPVGLDTRPRKPDDLYLTVRELASDQVEVLDALLKAAPPSSRSRAAQLRGFWADTMPAALAHPFNGVESPICNNLEQLEQVVAEQEG
jgi:hypothetical protein